MDTNAKKEEGKSMILEVQGRKLRVQFKYDEVFAVKRTCPTAWKDGSCREGEFFPINKIKKQPMEFVKDPVWQDGSQGYRPVDVEGFGMIPRRKRITAFITDTENPEKCPRAVQGEAICNPRDNFGKERGRRIALTRALRHCTAFMDFRWIRDNLTPAIIQEKRKVFRTEFWKKYLDLKKKQSTEDKEIKS
jgi:hypothetical protein